MSECYDECIECGEECGNDYDGLCEECYIQENPQLDTAIGRNCMECNSPLFMYRWVCIYEKDGKLELCRYCYDEYDK